MTARVSPMLACRVCEFSKLTKLRLEDTALSDDGLANLAGLTELTDLKMNGMKEVKGPGLQHLKGLTKLRELRLTGTSIANDAPWLLWRRL